METKRKRKYLRLICGCFCLPLKCEKPTTHKTNDFCFSSCFLTSCYVVVPLWPSLGIMFHHINVLGVTGDKKVNGRLIQTEAAVTHYEFPLVSSGGDNTTPDCWRTHAVLIWRHRFRDHMEGVAICSWTHIGRLLVLSPALNQLI